MRRTVTTAAALAVSVIVALVQAGQAQDLDAGIRLFAEGAYEEAAGSFVQVIEAAPDHGGAHGYLGLALVELNRWDDAEHHLHSASGDDPTRDRILVGLARIHVERRNADAALGVLNEAHGINDANPDVYYYRGLAHLSHQNFRPAADDFENALRLDPGRTMAHYYAGLAYNGLRQRDRMVDHFQTFLRLAPNTPEAARVRSLMRSL